MASDKNITLHYGDGSPPCWTVQIALEEKGIVDFTSKKYSFEKNEPKSEPVLAVNPRGELPCLEVGEVIVSESLAACLYLEEKFVNQGTRLLPTDVDERALVWQRLMEFYWNLPRRCYKHYISYLWLTPVSEQDPAYVEKARQECVAELCMWEKHLSESRGGFIAGDKFGICDVVAFPWFAFFERLGLKFERRFGSIHKYLDRLRDRPSIKKYWPMQWDGTINDTVLQDLN